MPLDKSSKPKTAFNSPFGKYEYIKLPFGLAQAPGYFQEMMTDILKEFDFVIAYLDDIIILVQQQRNISPTLDRFLTNYTLQSCPLSSANALSLQRKYNT